MVGVMDRCPTGIIGFDRMSQGGFVRNSDNLIVGGPGSGKTTFLLQFLWNGANQFGENGLYCSFEPDIVETLNDAMAYGWDFSKLSGEGRIKFMRFAPQTSIEELKGELTKIISRNNIKRVCFDPISVLALNLSEEGKIRQVIFDVSSLMKRLKVTTLFADEVLESEGIQQIDGDWSKTDILRFLSDSVTVLYESGIAGIGDRAIRIAKMRRTYHERKPVGMRIGSRGVEVIRRVINPDEMIREVREEPLRSVERPVERQTPPVERPPIQYSLPPNVSRPPVQNPQSNFSVPAPQSPPLNQNY